MSTDQVKNRSNSAQVAATLEDVIEFGALANTKLHAQLVRDCEKAAEANGASTLSKRKAHYSNKTFTARLDVDTPATMKAAMQAAVPTRLSRRSGRAAHRTTKISIMRENEEKDTDGADCTQLHLPNAGPLPSWDEPVPSPNNPSAPRLPGPTSQEAYIRRLTSRLEDCDNKRKVRGHSQSGRRSESRDRGSTLHDASGPDGGTTAALPVAGNVGNPAAAASLRAEIENWVETQPNRPPTASSTKSTQQLSALEFSRPASLLTQLRTGRFPPNASEQKQRWSDWTTGWGARTPATDPSEKSGSRKPDSGEDENEEVPSTAPTMMTELHFKQQCCAPVPREAAAGKGAEADTVLSPLDAADSSSESPHGSDHMSAPLLERLHTEPIYSYQILRGATSRPPSALVTRPRSLQRSLVGSGAIARENFARCRCMFEHGRYAGQAELLSFLDWRGQCRSAVCNSATTEKQRQQQASCSSRNQQTNSAAAATRILETLDRTAKAPRRRFSAPTGGNGAARMRPSRLESSWTEAATVLAVEKARERICCCLNSFTLDFPAAALSRESMEKLRREVAARVLQKPAPSLFSKEDLKRFLVSHQWCMSNVSSAPFLSQGKGLSETDIIDSLPSAAEAAFVRFAFEVLV